ncbi:hypothetical protein MASR2M66_30260 [Chloroflexota bacterium]
MAGDFMSSGVDAANLGWVMIWTFSRQSGGTDDCKTGWYFVLGMEIEQAFGVFKLEVTPVFWTPRTAGTIGSPLCIVIPEKK